jgi:phosphoglycerate dehydrogenase-like enzyme
MTKKILAWRSFYPEHIERIEKIAPDYEIVESLDDVANIDEIEIIYSWKNDDTTDQFMNHPSNRVKWIQTASAGIDYLPLDLLEEKEILLTNSSGIHANGIAESIFGMLLSYTRGIGKALIAQQKAEWLERSALLELKDKTIMIVGTGQIGRQTGKLAKAFGMKTIGINRSGREVEYMDKQFTQESLKEVINEADIVVNILPLTNETQEIFDFDLFKQMKESAIFINVGRGGTVSTPDLMEALEKKEIAYAALDVFHEEPLPADHPLWQRKDVLITPHFSGMLEDYDKSLFPIFEENLKAYVDGKQLPVNLVDYKKGY